MGAKIRFRARLSPGNEIYLGLYEEMGAALGSPQPLRPAG